MPHSNRPSSHFTPPRGWLNDPHGLTYHDGLYHLFYQHVPDSPQWAPHCHWGHAVSTDLVHWEHRPIALAPGDGDDGIWSGSLSVDDGQALAYYTAVSVPDFSRGRVRLARPTDSSWNTWEKIDTYIEAPSHLPVEVFRDPFIRRTPDGWTMYVGARLASRGDHGSPAAALLTYRSTDRVSWQFAGVAAQRPSSEHDNVWTGSLWECPQVFEVDGHLVLLVSVWHDDELHYVAYSVVDEDGPSLTPRKWHRLTYGEAYYAATFFRDRDGRPCLTYWLRGAAATDGTWTGAHAIPHLLSLRNDRLITQPHPEAIAAMSSGTQRPPVSQWPPSSPALILTSAAGAVTELTREQHGVVINGPTGTWTLPSLDRAEATVITDGPVAEVLLGPACFALAGADGPITAQHL